MPHPKQHSGNVKKRLLMTATRLDKVVVEGTSLSVPARPSAANNWREKDTRFRNLLHRLLRDVGERKLEAAAPPGGAGATRGEHCGRR